MALYSFDTSAILNGRRDLFPPAVFKSLWWNVEEMISSGDIRAVDVVRDELVRRADEVSDWACLQDDLFVPLSLEIQAATTRTLGKCPRLVGQGGGRNGADPFVIALALATGGTVVTEERMTGSSGRPRIPDACKELGVRCVSLVDFVVEQGWSW